MMAALIFIAAGLVLLGLLIFLSLGSRNGFQNDIDSTAADSLPASVFLLGSQRLAQRIFSLQDLEFISREAPWLRSKFRRERRAIGVLWIVQMRQSVRAVLHSYRLSARASLTLHPGAEIRLALSYSLFLTACAFAQGLLWLSPFASRMLVSHLATVGGRIRSLSKALQGDHAPVQWDVIREE